MTGRATPAFDKTALRLRMRGLRRRLAAEAPDAAARAAERLPLDRLPPFKAFAIYHPQGSELDPVPMARRLAEGGAATLLPVAETRDRALVFRVWSPELPLEPDAVGVPSPPRMSGSMTPQLIVAPLLAFDRQGGRLGQGGGHYDRTLQALRRTGQVFILGLAYAGQELAEIPMEPHDERLDAVLTEAGYIELG
ncbi:MAG: 5-formyltetrahydrofolate cyclo-ligase [Phenylobacterium sp.]|nr:MAG: 5-formyltetrahydrofolate cyclo-ligase [Phenylobacterium sp.]